MWNGTLPWVAGGSKENASEEMKQRVYEVTKLSEVITQSILTRQNGTEKKEGWTYVSDEEDYYKSVVTHSFRL